MQDHHGNEVGRIVAGVDGCNAGWFAVWGDGGQNWKFGVFPDILKLWRKLNGATLILVDIPIGLPSNGPRRCDIEARILLGRPRGSSVFPAPCREAARALTEDEAKNANTMIMHTSISRQCWGICPKIRQVDELLQSDKKAHGVVREGHPEVAFRAFAGFSMVNKKSTAEGIEERKGVLRRRWPAVDKLFDQATASHLRRDVGRDDILDAVAMYLTAASPAGSLRTIPEKPEQDLLGLPMEMVFSPGMGVTDPSPPHQLT